MCSHLTIPDGTCSNTVPIPVCREPLNSIATFCSIALTQSVCPSGSSTNNNNGMSQPLLRKKGVTLLLQQLIVVEVTASGHDQSEYR